MLRRLVLAAVVLAVTSTATVTSSEATTNGAVSRHKLIVVVKKNLTPAAEKRLAILVLVSQDGGAPAGAVATPTKPVTMLLANRGFYRVKAEIDSRCRGTCAGSYRIAGSADHKLEVVPSCQPKGSGFVCSKVRLVKID